MHRFVPAPAALLVVLLTAGLVVAPLAPATAAPASAGDPPASSGDTGQFPVPLPTAPEGDVRGVNDWGCRPTAQRPTPVVLVHGTFGDRRHLLEPLSHAIMDAGHCLFSLDYGNRATGDVAASARTLKRFVDRVRRSTGAAKVSLVGHSQGGMMPRHYLKFLGGAQHVDDLVGIAPSNHGTRVLDGLAPLMGVVGPLLDGSCRSCTQQRAGSSFLRRLNAGDETPGRVSYTQITTAYDEVVVPHTSGHLEDGPRTTNLTLQDHCLTALPEHLLIVSHPVTIDWTLDALSRPGPAGKTQDPAC